MSKISLIVAVDEANGIGKDNLLLCHLPADLAHFKKITMGKPIIMGRKTFESIGRPLPGRENIVLSHTQTKIDGVTVFTSLGEAIEHLSNHDEVVIIGGAKVFAEAMSLTSTIYLTKIHHQFEADAFFPALNDNEWNIISLGQQIADDKNPYNMSFYLFEKR